MIIHGFGYPNCCSPNFGYQHTHPVLHGGSVSGAPLSVSAQYKKTTADLPVNWTFNEVGLPVGNMQIPANSGIKPEHINVPPGHKLQVKKGGLWCDV